MGNPAGRWAPHLLGGALAVTLILLLLTQHEVGAAVPPFLRFLQCSRQACGSNAGHVIDKASLTEQLTRVQGPPGIHLPSFASCGSASELTALNARLAALQQSVNALQANAKQVPHFAQPCALQCATSLLARLHSDCRTCPYRCRLWPQHLRPLRSMHCMLRLSSCSRPGMSCKTACRQAVNFLGELNAVWCLGAAPEGRLCEQCYIPTCYFVQTRSSSRCSGSQLPGVCHSRFAPLHPLCRPEKWSQSSIMVLNDAPLCHIESNAGVRTKPADILLSCVAFETTRHE